MLKAAARSPRAEVNAVTFGDSHEPVTGRGLMLKRLSSSYTYAGSELKRARPVPAKNRRTLSLAA